MKISVSKFQELYKTSLLEMDDVDKAIILVKILTDKTDEQVNKMKVSKFNQLCAEIKKIFDSLDKHLMETKPQKYVLVNRRLYRLNYDITKMTAGKYIEASTFSSDVVGNLHKMLATMAVPCKLTWRGVKEKYMKHEDIANDMLDVEFSVGYHACVFFYAVLMIAIKNSSISGSKLEAEVVEKSIQLSTRLSGGFTMPSWLQTSSALN